MKEVKTAILGGSFDPVHLGHLFLLHNTVSLTQYKKFILIPASLSNFKQKSKPVSSPADRLKMLELALNDYRTIYPQDKEIQIEISDIELARGGVSYTYDTVIEIKNRLNIKDRIGLIIGDDHIENLSRWYRFDDLKNEVEFLVCPRNLESDSWEMPKGSVFTKLITDSVAVENATAIRNNLNENYNFLSESVKDYVRKNHLYS